ncbi:MAG: hypothetical protein LUF30_03540, partial [Lachnospiraceae bacterium]|nr:hypothetical protein [Lachnospiraceae bacterium]
TCFYVALEKTKEKYLHPLSYSSLSKYGLNSSFSDTHKKYNTSSLFVIIFSFGIKIGTQHRARSGVLPNKDLISVKDFADWDEGKLSTDKAFAEQARRGSFLRT